MAETRDQVVQRYIQDVIAAEHAIEAQLRSFAADSDDDDDVRALMIVAADASRDAAAAFRDAGGGAKNIAAETLAGMPRAAQVGHIREERIVQNLIAAYTHQMSRAGMYHALRNTINLPQAEQAITAAQDMAARLFHLIPTRSIIAYNMLTVTEVDPAVETKYREASWST